MIFYFSLYRAFAVAAFAESNNKFVRRYLERFSRKSSPVEQIRDAISNFLEREDPNLIPIYMRSFLTEFKFSL